MIFERFLRAVEDHGLIAPTDRILAAVSGGGDSVALLRLLLQYARRVPVAIVVAHVHHGLRGAAADEDLAFVEELAGRFAVEFVGLRPRREEEIASLRRGEEGARIVRHALLASAARAHGCQRIALGHTMDNQAETVLMRLARGAGRRGLAGMAPAGPGRLIRPMLEIRREGARDWLKAIDQKFRDDETNDQPRFLRNKIRARLLPLLAELNPSIVRTLSRNAVVMSEEDAYLDLLASEWLTVRAAPGPADDGSWRVPASSLASLPPVLARRAARLLLKRAGGDPRGTPRAAVEQMLQLARGRDTGAGHRLPGGIFASVDGLDLVIRGGDAAAGASALPATFSIALKIPGGCKLPGNAGALTARVLLRGELGVVPSSERVVALDASLLGSPVTVRNRQPGDTFHPLGAAGHRKLKEFMIDCKMPRSLRDRVPLVVGPAGIAWVVGYRIGHAYRLTDVTRVVALLEAA